MPTTVRKTGERDEMDLQWQCIASLLLLVGFSTFGSGAIGNGTTAGRLRTTASMTYRIAGREATKASTDDLWNLSAETNTPAATYRAYWLYLNAAGAASFVAGSNAASAAAALAALPPNDETLGIAGVYVAGPATDFDGAGGLAAQGTIHNGIPAGAPCGVRGKRSTYLVPARVAQIAK